MKKLYIFVVTLAVIGLFLGILYITVIRQDSVDIPKNVMMETAFGGKYYFGDNPKKVRMIEFIYINCTDVCPTTTLKMSQLQKRLESAGVFGNKVEFITITIDPERDTKEKLQLYAERFNITGDNTGWYFLRGSEKDTKKITAPFQFLYRDLGKGNFVHSTFTYLIDENNKQIETFLMGAGFETDKVFKKIMKAL